MKKCKEKNLGGCFWQLVRLVFPRLWRRHLRGHSSSSRMPISELAILFQITWAVFVHNRSEVTWKHLAVFPRGWTCFGLFQSGSDAASVTTLMPIRGEGAVRIDYVGLSMDLAPQPTSWYAANDFYMRRDYHDHSPYSFGSCKSHATPVSHGSAALANAVVKL